MYFHIYVFLLSLLLYLFVYSCILSGFREARILVCKELILSGIVWLGFILI